MPTFVRPSAIAASTSRSRGVSADSGSSARVPDHELGDHLGIERGAAASDAAQRVHELADVADAVLEQVADAARAIREELRGVLPLDVLAEDEHGRAGHATARLDRRAQALVPLARRHPDVDDGHVRAVGHDGFDERRAVTDLRDDRSAGLLDQPRDAFADESRVLRDDHAQRGGFHRSMMHDRVARRVAT